MSVLDNFDQWKDFLADRLHQGQESGLQQQTINEIAYQIGEYLAEHVDPQNDEERLLKELWDVSNEEERHVMANLMVKLVQGEGSQGFRS
jgi:cell shape-determining protein MreC